MASAASLKRKSRRKFRAMPLLALLAVGGVGGWWYWTKVSKGDGKDNPMITAPVTRGDLVETVSATGSVVAQTGAQVKIGSQVSGRVKRLYADVGSAIKAGEIIAELDLPDVEAQVNQAQASVAASRARLTQQETNLKLQKLQTTASIAQAQSALKASQSRLAATQAGASLQFAQTPTTIRRAEAELNRSAAALATSRAQLTQVEANARLQVTTAQEQLKQAQANAVNSALNLKRQRELLAKGFVAASLVDSAVALDAVNQSQVSGAQQNVTLLMESTKANVSAAHEQVAQAQQTLDSARAALEAAKAGTYQDKASTANVQDSQAQTKQAQATLELALANQTQNTVRELDVQAAKEQVRVSEAQLKQAQVQYERAFIRSPIAGTVLQLASQQGEVLAAGLSVQTVIIVADLKRLQVDVFVDETDIGKIKIGQDAKITVDAYPRRAIPGKVRKVASGSTIQQGVVTYSVTVSIDDPKVELKPDMTASVTIETGKRTGVLLVPAEAVKVGVKGSTVNILTKKDDKDAAEPKPVKTGATDGVSTEIREGLKEGETVVLAGSEDPNKRRGGNSNNPFGPQQQRGGSGGGGGGGGGGGRRGN